MRVPDTVRKCVVYIGIRHSFSDIEYGGTAFVVGFPRSDPTLGDFLYLVTAKHNLKKVLGTDYVIRVNLSGGRSVAIEAANTEWYYSSDDSVDVAITPFGVEGPEKVQIAYVPVGMFMDSAMPDCRTIGEGDEVFVTGLFTAAKGDKANMPIVRTGNVALIPTEQIHYPPLGYIDAYLIESRSIGGLSGCPVFVRETLTIPVGKPTKDGRYKSLHGGGPFYFLGSMIGHWDIDPTDKSTTLAEAVNMGISAVVPAIKIREILMQPEQIEMRVKREKQLKEKRSEGKSTLDSGFTRFTKDDFETALKKASRKVSQTKE